MCYEAERGSFSKKNGQLIVTCNDAPSYNLRKFFRADGSIAFFFVFISPVRREKEIYVKLISKPRLPLSDDCTQVTK